MLVCCEISETRFLIMERMLNELKVEQVSSLFKLKSFGRILLESKSDMYGYHFSFPVQIMIPKSVCIG